MTTTDPTVPSTAPQPAPLDLDGIEARAGVAAPSRLRVAAECIPEGQIRQGAILTDGDTVQEAIRAACQVVYKDVPALVAEVRRLRAELERWRTGRRWHSLPQVPQVPDAIPHAAAMLRAASDEELPEPVADLLRSGALRLKAAADAYGIVAAKLAEATADRLTDAGQTYEAVIARQRAERDAAPAAPDRLSADFAKWLEHRDLPPGTTLAGLIRHEREVAAIQARFEDGPLSAVAVPPAETGGDHA